MSHILITGATGNIGFEVVRHLTNLNTSNKIIAGVRSIEKAKKILKDYPTLDYVPFDFENLDTFDTALAGIEKIFLLRPPHISDVDKYFRPLISMIKKHKVNEIVFYPFRELKKAK